MIFIAHRGNIDGEVKHQNFGCSLENTSGHINRAIAMGFHVEVDVRIWNSNLCFGHDEVGDCYVVKESDLNAEKCFYHLKDIRSKQTLDFWSEMTNTQYKYFYNNLDRYSLVSDGHVWTYPGPYGIDRVQLNENTIYMSEESPSYISKDLVRKLMRHKVYGVCSDYVLKFRTYYEEILKEEDEKA